jgi:hypothetical protein
LLKTLGITAGAIAVAALVASSGVPVAAAPADLTVVSVLDEEHFVDNAPRGEDSLGDVFIFSSNVKKNGDKVGRAGVTCTLTDVSTGDTQCIGSFSLRNGQIAIQGLLSGDSGRQFSFPIVGGTGRYEDAGGTLTVRELRGNRERLTFEFS